MWRLNDCNWTWTQNHLVRKRTLNDLTKLSKWLSHVLSTYLYGAIGCIVLLLSFQSESTLYPASICCSWRRLQNVSSLTVFHLPRCFEDVLKSFWRRLANTSWRRLGRRKIVMLKMSWRHVLKTSRRYVLKTSWRQTKCLLEISFLTNLNLYQINLYLIYLSLQMKANPICINYNSIISIFFSSWNSSISILRIKISDNCLVVVKSGEFKFDISELVRQ